MRNAALLTALAILTLFTFGCDSGSDNYNISGDYTLGSVQFVYGQNKTWTLRDVIVTVDTSAGDIFFSGIDRNGDLWGYSGRYRHSADRIIANDLPEIYYGSADRLDLRLEFTSSSRFEGVAINWVYDGDRLADVGAVNIAGRETYIRSTQAREVAPASAEKTPKLELIDQQD